MKLKETYGDYKHYASGKVREVFYDESADIIALVATDRVSAFDKKVGEIPDKGKILTGISAFWSHWINFSDEVPCTTAFLASNSQFTRSLGDESEFVPDEFDKDPNLADRVTYMFKLDMFPIECIVRGHITGSAWKMYEQGAREICGVKLPDGLRNGDPFPGGPIFTPTTKAAVGHDENITFDQMVDIIEKKHTGGLGSKAKAIRECCLELYKQAYAFAYERGLIIADTKFELGETMGGTVFFGDEILTPDSSRFWDVNGFEPGKEQPSFDKQIIRDYIAKNPNRPIPKSIIKATRQRYIECYEKLSGQKWLE